MATRAALYDVHVDKPIISLFYYDRYNELLTRSTIQAVCLELCYYGNHADTAHLVVTDNGVWVDASGSRCINPVLACENCQSHCVACCVEGRLFMLALHVYRASEVRFPIGR